MKKAVFQKFIFRAGDCLLQIDGEDLLGLKMSDIAFLIGRNNRVKIQVWRQRKNIEKKEEIDREVNNDDRERRHVGILALEGPLPEVAIKLSSAVSGVVRALECPVSIYFFRIFFNVRKSFKLFNLQNFLYSILFFFPLLKSFL